MGCVQTVQDYNEKVLSVKGGPAASSGELRRNGEEKPP